MEEVLDPRTLNGEQSWGPSFRRLDLDRGPAGHPPGTIIVISGYLARYAAMIQSLITMKSPQASCVSWSCGVNIDQNLNNSMAQMTGEWVWIMGDDHVFAPDTLVRLLDHQVDCVTALCRIRQPPYSILAFRSENPDGSYELWPEKELPLHGLHPCAAAGGAGWLIRKPVIEALTRPYFEMGKIRRDEPGEDLYLYKKIRQAGFQPYIDCDTLIGHITPTALWPSRTPEGAWDITLDPTCSIPQTAQEAP